MDRIKKLNDLGFDITWEEVIDEAGPHPPLGVTIAQVLLTKGDRQRDPRFTKYLSDKNRHLGPYLFYKDYFAEEKPAFVPRRNINLIDVLAISPETGGVPVLAHPGAYFQKTKKEDVAYLKEKGLQGLEVFTTYHNSQETGFYLALAKEFDLIPTAGSDFHGTIKPHIPFGCVNNGGYWIVESLRKRRS